MKVVEYKDVPYGPYERNKLDAYIVKNGEVASPVLIFFHGGGYLSGDKDIIHSYELMDECLKAGISVVSCNYRFISTDPFPAPMEDGTRAIQFVRSKAEEWGINSNYVATAGSSAGGHIALWNALKGDLAEPDSQDPIKRYSTRVSGFIGFGTQVSKDQRFYHDIYDGPHIQPNLALYLGVKSEEDLWKPETLKIAEEASAITYMSAEAPPAFMVYHYPLNEFKIAADAPVGEVIHHPMHGYILKKQYERYNIPFVLRHSDAPVRPGEMVEFLRNCFQRELKTSISTK